jgi:hypothetical protein
MIAETKREATADRHPPGSDAPVTLDLVALYDRHATRVWRTALALGVDRADVDDASSRGGPRLRPGSMASRVASLPTIAAAIAEHPALRRRSSIAPWRHVANALATTRARCC